MEIREPTSISILPSIKRAAGKMAKAGKWRTVSSFAEEAILEKIERENRKATK